MHELRPVTGRSFFHPQFQKRKEAQYVQAGTHKPEFCRPRESSREILGRQRHFQKSMEHRKEGETYTFYDGPPTANGKPHIGHVETRTIKDMIPRYRTMKGYMVPRKPAGILTDFP